MIVGQNDRLKKLLKIKWDEKISVKKPHYKGGCTIGGALLGEGVDCTGSIQLVIHHFTIGFDTVP